ncbi:hypothetical protein PVT68_16675 [Microbulbifer bruguierae]|uniref:Capsule biosynthesis protein n=1 Tax=Microbulbifer bruguierae TaxID=3029061 RepID=A0ABY8NBU1_9GAMM|nr:hypothetical protein [Microbulbifer bruguierae]WGL16386.1 hypothetical protein PVT68_16675 [Microbulbifer bruguierae]
MKSGESASVQPPQNRSLPKLKHAANTVKGVFARIAQNEPTVGTEKKASRQGWRRWQGLILFVLVPLLLVGGYYLFWVSERFVSTTQIIVKENGSEETISSSLGFLVPGGISESQDAYLVVNYVQSLDMALALDKKLELGSYYKSDQYDFFSRLAGDASQEDFLKYYREHVSATFDEKTGIITISAQAFEPEFARRQVELLKSQSEDFVNELSNQLAFKQVEFVRKELDRAKDKLRTAKEQVLSFQNRHQMVSPEAAAQGVSGIIQGMEARLSGLRTQLTASKAYLNSDSSKVVSIQTEIEALESQIEQEKVRLVGEVQEPVENEGERLNSLSAEFQNLQLEMQFAMDAYQTALKGLETARMEASNNLKHLMTVTSPSLPEEAEFPRKLYNLISLAVVLLLLYGIGKMLVASIRDHRI